MIKITVDSEFELHLIKTLVETGILNSRDSTVVKAYKQLHGSKLNISSKLNINYSFSDTATNDYTAFISTIKDIKNNKRN